MYESFLFMHSWLRWAVLVSVLVLFARATWSSFRAREFKDSDLVTAFGHVFGCQVLLGISLWISMSPNSRVAFRDWSLVSQSPIVFFWTIRHPLTMVSAFVIFNAGCFRARRSQALCQAKSYAQTLCAVVLTILSAIPWPGLSYGRDLFRWFF